MKRFSSIRWMTAPTVCVLLMTGCGTGIEPTPSASSIIVPANAIPKSRYDLANGCYALQSAANGAYAVHDASGAYAATAPLLAGAESFFMKPSALGKYLIQAKDKTLLAVSGTGVGSLATPADAADWTVNTDAQGAYTVASESAAKVLAVDGTGKLILAAAATAAKSGQFNFVPASGCTPFPELSDDVAGETYKGQGVDKPVIGFADIHSHVSVEPSFYGGGTWWGHVFHRFGVAYALGDCEPVHGPMGVRDGNNVITTNPTDTHDTKGWPTFIDWPAANRLTHQGAYYKWLERTWKAGLRLIVMNGTNIDALCQIGRIGNSRPDFDCDDMRTAEAQIAYQRAIQDYVDAQEGGPGKGWFRIVGSPAEARAVINDGKLAVVPGIEVAHIFNCKLTVNPDGSETSGCDKAEIDRQLDKLWDMGVRSLFPIHDVDSSLGGAGIFSSDAINVLNFYDTHQFWKTYDCPTDQPYFYNAGALMATTATGNITSALNAGTAYKPGAYPQCNARGLSDLGKYAIRQLMKKKMVIEIDHMELSIKGEVIAMAKAQNPPYPVVSAHGGHGGITMQQAKDIIDLGGIIYPYKRNGKEHTAFVEKVKPLRNPNYLFAVGYGSDINGFGKQSGPRGAAAQAVKYPFTLFQGAGWGPQFVAAGIQPLTINQSQVKESGRKWNVDEEGQAHYGLVADFVEETRIEGGEEAITDLYNSAEGYLQMWERTFNR